VAPVHTLSSSGADSSTTGDDRYTVKLKVVTEPEIWNCHCFAAEIW